MRRHSPRIRQKRRRARSEILETARQILSDEGIAAVTLNSVAGAMGMTKQALYHYFASKDALLGSLVAMLLEEEVETLVAAVEAEPDPGRILGRLIRAFYDHYISRLDAFRLIYCQTQLSEPVAIGMDSDRLRSEINPRTRHLFDVLEDRLAASNSGESERHRQRRRAFSAWTAALGLMTMLSIADRTRDPLVHSDDALLATLSRVFNANPGG